MGSTEDSDDTYRLKWNDFYSSAASSFAALRNDSDLCDVTLVCSEGRQLEAHKIILAACSGVFKQMLRTSFGRGSAREPAILLWDATTETVEALLNFMYLGETSVSQEQLNSFLALAERLQVRGLTKGGPRARGQALETNVAREGVSPSSASHKPTRRGGALATPSSSAPRPSTSTSTPTKRRRLNLGLSPLVKSEAEHPGGSERKEDAGDHSDGVAGDDDDESNESLVLPLETEMRSSDGVPFSPDAGRYDGGDDDDDDGLYEANHEDLGSMPDGRPSFDSPKAFERSSSFQADTLQPEIGSEAVLDLFRNNQPGMCPYCHKFLQHVKRHVEDVHCPQYVPCTECGKIFTSTNKMRVHRSYVHRRNRNLLQQLQQPQPQPQPQQHHQMHQQQQQNLIHELQQSQHSENSPY